MDAGQFDAFLAAFSRTPSRRAAIRLLGGIGLSQLVQPADARKKRKQKKKCAGTGKPTSKKRKSCCAGLVQDAAGLCAAPLVTPPPCQASACPTGACGKLSDGCGGTRQCGNCSGDAICVDGTCRPCTITCPTGATDCAAALETTAAAGGTVYVCPGLYEGDILLASSVTVIGAGEGNDPASNTILKGTGARSVLRIDSPLVVTVTLQNLRITAGGGGPGSGVQVGAGAILSVIGCTIHGNNGQGSGGAGGGIFTAAGSRLSLTNCTISGNSASNSGGGINNFAGRVSLINTLVSGNTAAGTQGGGIHTDGGAVTLDALSRVTGNGARPTDPDSGGGIHLSSMFNLGGTVTLASSDNVTGNTPDNCGGNPIALCVD